MTHSRLTRWIVALTLLAATCVLLPQMPQLHDFAALLWFSALLLLIIALVLAVVRDRRQRRPR
ncbi:hypothetical protein [Brevibacterium spongiae]|uniref:Uncharacterized protein n=1 Tax=Brevibacterium spongiae TaxID=2909672 RepID=A0ABY5SN92_9MICO|nr:hypothetical protein [Brevibacterium spongiae]UVI36042.1 hypothetical protein L1F31_18330 [Brevibacterium spongiae]